jgi:predicted alpha/beta superfamily hydrolase
MGETYTQRSRILGENRTLYVYLHKDYESSEQLSPVLYLLDGDMLFNYTAATVDYYINTYRIPAMIVVGIESTDRRRDFIPPEGGARAGRQDAPSGGADAFLRYMKEEVFLYIDRKYQTRQYRAIIGHSLSGLFVLNTLITEPSLFSAYMALSPFLAWDNEVIIQRTESFFKRTQSLDKLLFVASEPMSGDGPSKPLENFVHLLETYCPKGLQWESKIYKGSDHMSLPLFGIPDGLDFFFPGFVQER